MSISFSERILILDFGAQYTQLIARRVRELNVYAEIHPCTLDNQAIQAFRPAGIILSGGPNSSTEEGSLRAPEMVFQLGVPVLGICYGMQTMAMQLGGEVQSADRREFGQAQIELVADSPLFAGLEKTLPVWMSHGDHVTQLPAEFKVIGQSANCPIAAMSHHSKPFYAVQFHPEVTHTRDGKTILANFVHHICGCSARWTASEILSESIAQIKHQVGKEEVLLGLSGGVDSSVAAALLHRAIGEQLTCVFVDTGLLRLDEALHVKQIFSEQQHIKVIYIDAQAEFLKQLEGITDPEAKRKTIGRVFIEVFEREAAKLPAVKWLAQGTIYSDVIESAAVKGSQSQVIKSHHNVGGLPERLALKLLEPLRYLFKDEVRQMGVTLGLPREMVYRHPFPGPGLGVRILGEIKAPYLDILKRADAIFIHELRQAGWYSKVSQAFAVFLPVKSVGVVGDARQYEYVIALRAVETIDFMTAQWAQLPYTLLQEVSARIINEVRGVSRVVYDISDKPPATIEWE